MNFMTFRRALAQKGGPNEPFLSTRAPHCGGPSLQQLRRTQPIFFDLDPYLHLRYNGVNEEDDRQPARHKISWYNFAQEWRVSKVPSAHGNPV